MFTQRKQGFTLIELMVVIVIIGILAAIAIPKLFGMTAKAKVQEIGPAAGTWSKLMTAWIMEQGGIPLNSAWDSIGYIPPGGEEKEEASNTANFSYSHTTQSNWQAKADKEIGNGCAAGAVWIGDHSNGTSSVLTPIMTNATGKCGDLTPNFVSIGKPAAPTTP